MSAFHLTLLIQICKVKDASNVGSKKTNTLYIMGKKSHLLELLKELKEILNGLQVQNSFNVAVDFYRKVGEFPTEHEIKDLPLPTGGKRASFEAERTTLIEFLRDNLPSETGHNRAKEGKITNLGDLYFSNSENNYPICLGTSNYIFNDAYTLLKYRESVFTYLKNQAVRLNASWSNLEWAA